MHSPFVSTSHTLTSSTTSKGVISWKINHFSAINKKNGEWIESVPVQAGKYKWVLRLFPAGMNEENKGFLSCYLRVADVNTLVADEVSVKFVLSVIANGDSLMRLKTNQVFDRRHVDWGWPQCISLESVRRAMEKDDNLLLETEFEVFHDWKTTEIQGATCSRKIELPTSNLVDDMDRLLMSDNDSFSDVTFVVNKKHFSAHKNILSARSRVFCTMFKSGMRESKDTVIPIEDTDEVTFREMLKFIYCGQCDQSILQDKTVEVLAIADRYDIQCLKLMCEDVLLQRLTVENAADTLSLADTYHSCQLKKFVVDFMVENFFQVLATEGFKDLCIKMPLLVSEVHEAVAINVGTKKVESSSNARIPVSANNANSGTKKSSTQKRKRM